MSDDAQVERVDWRCGWGNGRLKIPVSEVPAQCGL